MEEGIEGKFWSMFKRIFRKDDASSIEAIILAARDEGEIRKEEASIVLKVLRLGRKQVHEIMIPRTDIVCAEIEDRIEDVAELIIAHGHTRIPIYKDNKDNIVGIVHAKDLLQFVLHPTPSPRNRLEEILREPLFIPETKNVMEMLQEFQSRKNHLAIALDEYGGTSGMLTFEDVLEEIVGDIEDEYDAPRPDDIQVQGDGGYLISGRTELTELRENLVVDLDSDQVDTIGGYLSQLAGRVPRKGDVFDIQDFRFRIKDADQKKVRWIDVQPLETESGPEA
ncbi:hemolysin family protein [Desulfonatronum lacustre]|uniref:hemolysin family protein n=1 Tax=Desulfonatronum lacustre TaxID=66849 RepID=UPI00048DA723|nr:hemolysin family protein [Desulfonatronum lacustre]SMP68379.1 magnesium and cobalt transporter [Desulfonatronum zhilinae]